MQLGLNSVGRFAIAMKAAGVEAGQTARIHKTFYEVPIISMLLWPRVQ